MTEPRGTGAGPWVMAGIALAVPTTALVIVMARYWSPLLNFAVVGGAVAVALTYMKVVAPLHWHSVQNRMQRDSARTIEVQGRALQPPPALTDGARAGYLEAQTEALRWELERNRSPAAVDGPRIKVWDQQDDEGGYGDGE